MNRLAGTRIVVTRAPHQAEELAAPLRSEGAEVILLPVIDIAPPENQQALTEAAARTHEYKWIIFTSTNAVSFFADALPFPAKDCTAKIAVIGNATRAAAERLGFKISLVPEAYVAEELVSSLEAVDLNRARILIPSAALTRDVVASELRKRGASVDLVVAYRNILPQEAAQNAHSVFRPPYPDWATFTSSSCVHNLVSLIGTGPLQQVKIATIGEITSNTVCEYGLTVTAQPELASISALVAAILQRCS